MLSNKVDSGELRSKMKLGSNFQKNFGELGSKMELGNNFQRDLGS